MFQRQMTAIKHDSGESPAPRAQDQAEQRGEARFRSLAEQRVVAIYTCDASGVIQYYNDRATELWGRRPPSGFTDQRFCGSFKLYRADGSYMPHEQCPMADVLSGRASGVSDAEVHIERPDGTRVIAIVNIAPMIDGAGDTVGAVSSFYEICESRYCEAAQEKQAAH